jgi:hypothetical protein
MNAGEASALSYLIAFAALNHPRLTRLEDSLVTKVSQLDPDAFSMWRAGVMRAQTQEPIGSSD